MVASNDLIQYVRTSLASQFPEEDIRKALASAGWQTSDINEAFAQVQGKATPPAGRPPVLSAVMPQTQVQQIQSQGHTKRNTFVIAVTILIVLAGSGIGYAYFNSIWPFAAYYQKDKIISGVFEKIGAIESASYALVVSIESQPRDKDATPFESQEESFQGLSYIPGNLHVALKMSGTSQKQSAASSDSRFQIGIDVNADDFVMNADVELLKKGDALFGRINKFPGLFFDVSKIKQKWIRATTEDLGLAGVDFMNFSSALQNVTNNPNDNKQIFEQVQLFFSLLEKEGVVTFGSPAKDTVGTISADRYTLNIHQDKVVPFYKSLVEASKRFGKDALVPASEVATTTKYLESANFQSAFEYFVKNTKVTLWLDRSNGFPIKSSYGFRFVPSAQDTATQDKQVYLMAELTLSDINKKINIDAPSDFISLEDAMLLISGISKEEYTFEKQAQNITMLQASLNEYKQITGKFPDSLSDLTKTRAEIQKLNSITVTDKNSLYYSSYLQDKPLMKSVPQDAYSQKPFEYTKTATDYKISYTVALPPYKKGEQVSYLLLNVTVPFTKTGSKYSLKYVEGNNTLTSKSVSEEASAVSKIDSDNDNVSDSLEIYLGTNKNKKDTDGDGVSDGMELQSSSDPLGPGKLKYPQSISPLMMF